MRIDTGWQPDTRPSGLQVSAQAVQSDIDAVMGSPVEGQRVAIKVRGADVTLTGQVHSWHERTQVRLSAFQACGVRNVVDMMTVRP